MFPLVSFVIPVRNDAVRLARCLASVTANDYPSTQIQLIVVDHHSTDGTADAAKRFGAVVLKGAGNSVAALRNQGAGEATGDIVAFVDADHEIDKRWIATAVEILADPSVGGAGSAYSPQPSSNWVQRQYDGLRQRPAQREAVTWLGSGNLAMRSEVFRKVGGFNAALIACEDVDLCNRLRGAGYLLIADPGLRSVHYGDPATLKALFFGELWRGRDNIRVTFAGPRTLRDWRSAFIPIVQLICIVAAVAALLSGRALPALAIAVAAMVPALLRALTMFKRQQHGGITAIAQALTIAAVFDLARALALVARGSHRSRRGA